MNAREKDFESLKNDALAAYVAMPVARPSLIAKRLGVPKEVIERWRETDNWLGAREDFKRQRHAELIERFGDPQSAADKALEFCARVEKCIEADVSKGRVKSGDCDQLVRAATNIYKLRQNVYEGIGLR